MVPTTRALAMRAQVHALVQQAHQLLSAQQELDLTALDRVFTVRWHDALTVACGTALTTAVRRQAPGVRLRLSAEPGADDAELRRGEVDLESSSSPPTLPDIRHRLVGRDRLIVAVRPGHPLTEGGPSPERYAAAEHLTVSRRGSLRDPIDDALTSRGLERRVVAAGPTAAFALQLAHDTDLVVTLPDAVTRTAREQLGLATLPPPFPLPEVPCTCCGTSATTTTAPTPGCGTWPPKPCGPCSRHRPPPDRPPTRRGQSGSRCDTRVRSHAGMRGSSVKTAR